MPDDCNEIVDGQIQRIENYGLYVSFSGGTALILIVDVAERRIDLHDEFHLGEVVRFRVVNFIPEEGLYKGSMVALGSEHCDAPE